MGYANRLIFAIVLPEKKGASAMTGKLLNKDRRCAIGFQERKIEQPKVQYRNPAPGQYNTHWHQTLGEGTGKKSVAKKAVAWRFGREVRPAPREATPGPGAYNTVRYGDFSW